MNYITYLFKNSNVSTTLPSSTPNVPIDHRPSIIQDNLTKFFGDGDTKTDVIKSLKKNSAFISGSSMISRECNDLDIYIHKNRVTSFINSLIRAGYNLDSPDKFVDHFETTIADDDNGYLLQYTEDYVATRFITMLRLRDDY